MAAIVAIVSFGLNYRATLRGREDAKFYEALNHFAEKANPSARSSAAGLLEQMASTKKRYFETAFDQIIDRVARERDDEARNAVRAAFGRLVVMDPETALAKLKALNRALREPWLNRCCRFCVARGSNGARTNTRRKLGRSGGGDILRSEGLTALLQIFAEGQPGTAALSAAAAGLPADGREAGGDDYRVKTRVELGECAERLRSNIRSISEVLLLLEGKGDQLPPVPLPA